MDRTGDTKKIFLAAGLLNDFCSDTACLECPIKRACNRISREVPIGYAIAAEVAEAEKGKDDDR